MRDSEGREGGERGAGVVLSVYVVSPLPAVRAGLRALVGEADDLRVAGEASSLEALARGPGREHGALDVVVLDAPPGTRGAGGEGGGRKGLTSPGRKGKGRARRWWCWDRWRAMSAWRVSWPEGVGPTSLGRQGGSS